MRHFVFLIAIFASLIPDLRAAEPFFKPNDVVALVGGEDMVVAAELGYLETLIQLALPDHHLKFRSLAREGDTVFEQRRDLNYPTLEAQLEKMGATVVICQFGQMESLAGAAVDRIDRADAIDKVAAANAESAVNPVNKVNEVKEKADATQKAKVAEFVAAYEGLIARLTKTQTGPARRLSIIIPPRIGTSGSLYGDHQQQGLNHFWNPEFKASQVLYSDAMQELAKRTGAFLMDDSGLEISDAQIQTDGIHRTESAHIATAMNVERHYSLSSKALQAVYRTEVSDAGKKALPQPALRTLITAKNRLWFHYYRPQNWAFLAGDRTNQPSSRDHLDPSKRWFPKELEKFVPLIDAKDAEIWALAKKLSAEGGK